MLLSKRGVVTRDGQKLLRVCRSCDTSLQKEVKPKRSIANRFAIGETPQRIRDLQLTVTEIALITPVYTSAMFVTLDLDGERKLPNGQKGMKGHVLSQRLDVQSAVSQLPRTANNVSLRVIVTSAFSTAQRAISLGGFVVRRRVVAEALQWLIAHNPLYQSITIDDTALRALPEDGVWNAVVQDASDPNLMADDAARAPDSASAAAAPAPALALAPAPAPVPPSPAVASASSAAPAPVPAGDDVGHVQWHMTTVVDAEEKARSEQTLQSVLQRLANEVRARAVCLSCVVCVCV